MTAVLSLIIMIHNRKYARLRYEDEQIKWGMIRNFLIPPALFEEAEILDKRIRGYARKARLLFLDTFGDTYRDIIDQLDECRDQRCMTDDDPMNLYIPYMLSLKIRLAEAFRKMGRAH